MKDAGRGLLCFYRKMTKAGKSLRDSKEWRDAGSWGNWGTGPLWWPLKKTAEEAGVTHLGAQGPGRQHVATVVEPVGLHLGVAGPTEVGEALERRRALEDLHVVHQGLVALGDDGLVLWWGGNAESGAPHPRDGLALSPPSMGLGVPICTMGALGQAISRRVSRTPGFEGGVTHLEPDRIFQKPVKSHRRKEMRTVS